jgi:O-antigen/teichoic acid export membrane protein
VSSTEISTAGSGGPTGARHGSYRSGFLFGILGFVAVAVVGALSTVVTSRLYGVRIVGEFALVLAPVSALWVLSTVKEQQALIREITQLPPRHPRVTQLFAVVFSFSTGLTLVMSVLTGAACWLVFRGPLHAPQLLWPTFANLLGYALVTNTGWNVDSVLAAFVAGRQLFWVRLHEVLSFLAIAAVAGVVGPSVWGLVVATVGSALTSLAHRLFVVRPFVRPRLSVAEYRAGLDALPALLRFGLRATPGQLAQGASQQGGVWAVGTVASVAVVGAYSRAMFVPQRLQQVSMRVNEVLYPTLVGRHARGDGEGFDRALIDSIRYEVVGMLLIAAAIGGMAQPVLELFGPGFGRAGTALVLLMLYPVLASMTVAQTQALWATNQPGRTSAIASLRLVVTVALLVILTPRMGIVGPAIALLAGYVLVAAMNGLALRPTLARPLRHSWPLRERVALVAAYAGGFLVARLVGRWEPSLVLLPLGLLGAALVYAGVFVLLGGVNLRDRERLRDAAALLRRRRRQRGVAKGSPGAAGLDDQPRVEEPDAPEPVVG